MKQSAPIPVPPDETKVRELDPAALSACHAVERDLGVLIGDKAGFDGREWDKLVIPGGEQDRISFHSIHIQDQ